MQKRNLFIGGGVVLVLILGGMGAWYYHAHPPVPQYPLAYGERVKSWTFTGPYADGGDLQKKATDEIARLATLLGKGGFPDYDILVGIAGQYELLGNGRQDYLYLNKAIQNDPHRALAYANMGHLMDLLREPGTARGAYARAVAAEPGVLGYRLTELDFLVSHFTNDPALAATFAADTKLYPNTPDLLSRKADWQEKTHAYTDAIATWQAFRELVPASSRVAVDARIALLRSKLASTH